MTSEGTAASQRTFYQVPVAEVIRETDQASSLVLAVPPELAAAFAYRPGQFLTVRVPLPTGGSVARCYSLCSSPLAGEPLAFTVKAMAGGYASGWLAGQVTPGTLLDLLPPAGTFTPRSLDADFLLLAGGSGITPVMSILRSALAAGTGKIVLVYANADERSVIFAARLRDLAAAQPGRLVVLHWLDTLSGPPHPAALRELCRPYAGYDAYVCGPDPYMAVARQALRELGVPAPRVHTERFLSLAENPFEVTAAAREAAGVAAELRVELDEQVHTLDWPAGRRMLDVMIDAGLAASYSCREGVCGACACRLVSGKVEMAHNEVLEEEDLAEGYVLACQSVALTAEVSVSYD
jgi:3-ketosteroid 9alpha-monooxygenase subunit B